MVPTHKSIGGMAGPAPHASRPEVVLAIHVAVEAYATCNIGNAGNASRDLAVSIERNLSSFVPCALSHASPNLDCGAPLVVFPHVETSAPA